MSDIDELLMRLYSGHDDSVAELPMREAADAIEQLQRHNSMMREFLREFGEAFNQKPIAIVKSDFEQLNALLNEAWKERDRLRQVLDDRNSAIKQLQRELEEAKRDSWRLAEKSDALKGELTEVLDALKTIAAQRSNTPGSTAKADCMASVASLALRNMDAARQQEG